MGYQTICKLMDISGYHSLDILRQDDKDFPVYNIFAHQQAVFILKADTNTSVFQTIKSVDGGRMAWSKQLYDVKSQKTLSSCNLLRRQKPKLDGKTCVNVFCRLAGFELSNFL
jgi:hypothetical protein